MHCLSATFYYLPMLIAYLRLIINFYHSKSNETIQIYFFQKNNFAAINTVLRVRFLGRKRKLMNLVGCIFKSEIAGLLNLMLQKWLPLVVVWMYKKVYIPVKKLTSFKFWHFPMTNKNYSCQPGRVGMRGQTHNQEVVSLNPGSKLQILSILFQN